MLVLEDIDYALLWTPNIDLQVAYIPASLQNQLLGLVILCHVYFLCIASWILGYLLSNVLSEL